MRVSSADGLSRLQLDVCDLEMGKAPQLAVLAEVELHGFRGERRAWLSLPVLERFAKELAALGEVPNGAAVLDSATPDELHLTVLSANDAGEHVVHVAMHQHQRFGARDYETSLSGALALDSSSVQHLAQTFRRWTDPKFLEKLADWGFDEKALLDE